MNSFVLIKLPKTGTETLKDYLYTTFINKGYTDNEILNVPYDEIMKKTEEKKYIISINHINYNDIYIKHLNKIMKYDLKLITCIREPLDRLISHYYYSNSHRKTMDFNCYYRLYMDKDEGWDQEKIRTNNYMSKYLGFKNINEITEENISKRYSFILILEFIDLGYLKLSKILKTDNISYKKLNCNKERKKDNLDDNLLTEFYERNKMDYELYRLSKKIYYNI